MPRPVKKNVILITLIDHYRTAIDAVNKEENYKWKEIVIDYYVHFGICCCAISLGFHGIRSRSWVLRRNVYEDTYWCKPTVHAVSKEEAIKLLKFRIKEMQNIIKTGH